MKFGLLSTRPLSTCKCCIYIITFIILQCNYIFMCPTPLWDSEYVDVLYIFLSLVSSMVSRTLQSQILFIKFNPQRLIRVWLNWENYSWASFWKLVPGLLKVGDSWQNTWREMPWFYSFNGSFVCTKSLTRDICENPYLVFDCGLKWLQIVLIMYNFPLSYIRI